MSFSDLKWAVVILNESSYKLFQCKNFISQKYGVLHSGKILPQASDGIVFSFASLESIAYYVVLHGGKISRTRVEICLCCNSCVQSKNLMSRTVEKKWWVIFCFSLFLSLQYPQNKSTLTCG